MNRLYADFYSDTQTKPTQAMLATVLDAELGDERHHACPTTNLLCERVAEMFGMEAALFLPSGTMANEIAIKVHTRPGDEVICAQNSHIVFAECGGPAAISGVMINSIDAERGLFDADQVAERVRRPSNFAPRSRLVVAEQTSNLGGGAVWPIKQLNDVARRSKDLGLMTHLDGARLLNASVATGIEPNEYVKDFDSAWLSFTKGLGCGVGAVLCGSKAFIDEAWQVKRLWGGAMRQTGVLTSMCLYALDHHVERLAEDHKLAQWIAAKLVENPLFSQIEPADTNIVLAHLSDSVTTNAPELRAELKKQGVAVMSVGERALRMIAHLDVDHKAAEVLINQLNALADLHCSN